MKLWVLKREYRERLISAKMDQVKFSNIERKRNGKTQKGIRLVMTYQSLLKSLGSIVNNNIYLLHMDQEIKRTFTPQPMVSYWSARKLSNYLVRGKLYPIERKVGSCKCNGKRCDVCINVLETDTFICSNDQTTYKIKHRFDCNEKCYKCLKQYVGKQYICLGHDVTTIKIILGNLTEEKTVRKDTFTNIFSYQAILAFCKIPTLLSLARPIIGHHEV